MAQELSLKTLIETCGDDVYETIKFAQSFYPKLPEKTRPVLLKHKSHSSIEIREYAEKLEKWEQNQVQYKKEFEQYLKTANDIESIIVQFIKEISGLNSLSVTEKTKDKIYAKAYDSGHSDGFYSVYQHLCSLVDLFN